MRVCWLYRFSLISFPPFVFFLDIRKTTDEKRNGKAVFLLAALQRERRGERRVGLPLVLGSVGIEPQKGLVFQSRAVFQAIDRF